MAIIPYVGSPPAHTDFLTRREDRCVQAILEHTSLSAAAAAVGLRAATVRATLQRPHVARRYREARAEMIREAARRLRRLTGKAIGALEAVLEDPGKGASAQVAAARTVIELALRASEHEELVERVDEMERSHAAEPGPPTVVTTTLA